MSRPHISDLHLAQRFTAVFAAAAGHHEQWHEPPTRTVPAATDWTDRVPTHTWLTQNGQGK